MKERSMKRRPWRRAVCALLTAAMLAAAAVPALAAAAVPALAAEKKTVTNEEWGLVITMEGFLREETHRYPVTWSDQPAAMTIYVVEDNSQVTVEAMEGRKYATTQAELDAWTNGLNEDGEPFVYFGGKTDYAYYTWLDAVWSGEGFEMLASGEKQLLEGRETFTVAPDSQNPLANGAYNIYIAAESDFRQFVPFEGTVKAAGWAQEELGKAYDAGLFPDAINPFEEDCARDMTRAEFAAVTVSLYYAMQGNPTRRAELLDTPFVDASGSDIGYAYHLGFVNGTSATTFSPNDTLTREQAAVMLSRVYAKLHGDIPAVSATAFADDASVSGWAKSGVAFMADKGIVSGVGGNSFAPQQTLSIQEAVVMAQRMLENLK